MAYKVFENYDATDVNTSTQSEGTKFSASGQDHIGLPQEGIIQNADLSREGNDLILETDNGAITIEGYFETTPAPDLIGPDGMRLTPELVDSFITSPMQYADSGLNASDASPIGAVQEITGTATITRANGTVETVGLGTPVFQGDIIETDESGAVNIVFVDETTFAVSEDARLSIDEYVFDAATQSGTTNFSVLKGVFVFTSGLIGRDDPDDVMINTPSGSIGIRGTIIAGDVDAGEITVIEGAIVLHDFAGNSITLANQFETARFNSSDNEIELMGNLSANEVVSKFMSVSTVAANLFSSIQDAANDTSQKSSTSEGTSPDENSEAQSNEQGKIDATSQEESEAQNSGNLTEEQKPDESSEEKSSESDETENSENDAEIITSEDITTADFDDITKNTAPKKDASTTTSEQSKNQPTTQPTFETRLGGEEQDAFIQQIDRTVKFTNPTRSAFFTGAANTEFTYDFSQEFSDPFNTVTGYTITGLSSSEFVSTPNFDSTTGLLDFDIDGTVLADSDFTFTITANTTLGDFSKNFTFDILKANTNGLSQSGGTILQINTVPGESHVVYNGDPSGATVTVSTQNASIFTGAGDDNIKINNNPTLVKSGDGDDNIIISPAGEHYVYTEDGNDTFTIENGVLNHLEVSGAESQINGGNGYDKFNIEIAGNLNFTNIDPNFVKNIEHLNLDNNQTNTITLRYSDVVRMTDSTNRLEINLDANDTLNFINTPGSNFTTGTQVVNGETFNTYTDGNITLLIDVNEASSVTGL